LLLGCFPQQTQSQFVLSELVGGARLTNQRLSLAIYVAFFSKTAPDSFQTQIASSNNPRS